MPDHDRCDTGLIISRSYRSFTITDPALAGPVSSDGLASDRTYQWGTY